MSSARGRKDDCATGTMHPLALGLAWAGGGDPLKRREILAAAATAGWPLPLGAQQKAAPVIGFLSNGNEKRGMLPTIFPEFRRGFVETGYVEGKNLTIELRFSDGSYGRLPAL